MDKTKEQIETVEFEGQTREYDFLAKDYWAKNGKDAPRYWIMYNEGRPVISNEVKQDYRPNMVLHELYEFEHNPDEPVRCLDALKAELSRLPEGEMEYYVPFRRDVFRELVSYWERQDEREQRNSILEGARESLSYLEKLERGN